MHALNSLILLVVLLVPAETFSAEKGMTVTGMWHFSHEDFTRIVLEVEEAAPYVVSHSNDGRSIVLSSYEGAFALKAPIPVVRDAIVAGVEPWDESGKTYIVFQIVNPAGEIRDFTMRNPDRIVLDIMKKGATAAPLRNEGPIVVVLDPGHGGGDMGLLSSHGLEKSINLEIAAAVGRILRRREYMQIVLTRERDRTLSPDTRAALSNAAPAAIFVSLHAGQGAETRVYLPDVVEDADIPVTLKLSDADAVPPGASASVQPGRAWGRQQAAFSERSRDLGRRIVRQFAGQEDAEPRQVSLAGLRAVSAPAVMVEVGLTADRAQAAEKIAKGIEQFVNDIRKQ